MMIINFKSRFYYPIILIILSCSENPVPTGIKQTRVTSTNETTSVPPTEKSDNVEASSPIPPIEKKPSNSPKEPDVTEEKTEVTPEPEIVATTSNGSGGKFGVQTTTGKNGGEFMINAPENNGSENSHGLLILLHGSGASNYENFVNSMNSIASDNGLIAVSILAPNGQGWNEGNQNQAADYLDEIIQEDLLKSYNVDLTKIFFSGQSSGGGFLSSHFIPLKSEKYIGGAFLQCGAAPPNSTFTPTEEHIKNFRLHFEITTGDTIWPEYYKAAIEYYTDKGMTLTSDNTKPGGHCQFSQENVVGSYIKDMITR